jgi:hypothetical protein
MNKEILHYIQKFLEDKYIHYICSMASDFYFSWKRAKLFLQVFNKGIDLHRQWFCELGLSSSFKCRLIFMYIIDKPSFKLLYTLSSNLAS